MAYRVIIVARECHALDNVVAKVSEVPLCPL
jgi:hypothetical protein